MVSGGKFRAGKAHAAHRQSGTMSDGKLKKMFEEVGVKLQKLSLKEASGLLKDKPPGPFIALRNKSCHGFCPLFLIVNEKKEVVVCFFEKVDKNNIITRVNGNRRSQVRNLSDWFNPVKKVYAHYGLTQFIPKSAADSSGKSAAAAPAALPPTARQEQIAAGVPIPKPVSSKISEYRPKNPSSETFTNLRINKTATPVVLRTNNAGKIKIGANRFDPKGVTGASFVLSEAPYSFGASIAMMLQQKCGTLVSVLSQVDYHRQRIERNPGEYPPSSHLFSQLAQSLEFKPEEQSINGTVEGYQIKLSCSDLLGDMSEFSSAQEICTQILEAAIRETKPICWEATVTRDKISQTINQIEFPGWQDADGLDTDVFDRLIQTVHSQKLESSCGQGVAIHCFMGAGRTPTLAIGLALKQLADQNQLQSKSLAGLLFEYGQCGMTVAGRGSLLSEGNFPEGFKNFDLEQVPQESPYFNEKQIELLKEYAQKLMKNQVDSAAQAAAAPAALPDVELAGPLQSMPPELKGVVMDHLDSRDLGRLSQTSRTMNSAVKGYPLLKNRNTLNELETRISNAKHRGIYSISPSPSYLYRENGCIYLRLTGDNRVFDAIKQNLEEFGIKEVSREADETNRHKTITFQLYPSRYEFIKNLYEGTREDAENELIKPRGVFSTTNRGIKFLCRKSSRDPFEKDGCFALSFLKKGENVLHFLLKREEDGTFRRLKNHERDVSRPYDSVEALLDNET